MVGLRAYICLTLRVITFTIMYVFQYADLVGCLPESQE